MRRVKTGAPATGAKHLTPPVFLDRRPARASGTWQKNRVKISAIDRRVNILFSVVVLTPDLSAPRRQMRARLFDVQETSTLLTPIDRHGLLHR